MFSKWPPLLFIVGVVSQISSLVVVNGQLCDDNDIWEDFTTITNGSAITSNVTGGTEGEHIVFTRTDVDAVDWVTAYGSMRISYGSVTWRVEIVSLDANASVGDMIIGVQRSDPSSAMPLVANTSIAGPSGYGYFAATGDITGEGSGQLPYGEPFSAGDNITVGLNIVERTLNFWKNDVAQGVNDSDSNSTGSIDIAFGVDDEYRLAVSLSCNCSVRIVETCVAAAPPDTPDSDSDSGPGGAAMDTEGDGSGLDALAIGLIVFVCAAAMCCIGGCYWLYAHRLDALVAVDHLRKSQVFSRLRKRDDERDPQRDPNAMPLAAKVPRSRSGSHSRSRSVSRSRSLSDKEPQRNSEKSAARGSGDSEEASRSVSSRHRSFELEEQKGDKDRDEVKLRPRKDDVVVDVKPEVSRKSQIRDEEARKGSSSQKSNAGKRNAMSKAGSERDLSKSQKKLKPVVVLSELPTEYSSSHGGEEVKPAGRNSKQRRRYSSDFWDSASDEEPEGVEEEAPLKTETKTCDICGDKLGGIRKYNTHMREVHGRVKVFSCPVCDKIFHRKYNMKVHKRTHDDVRAWVCPRDGCSDSFTQKSNLKRHLLTKHDKPVKCPRCEARFATHDEAQKHADETHGPGVRIRMAHLKKGKDDERVYRCACKKTFLVFDELKRHTAACKHVRDPLPSAPVAVEGNGDDDKPSSGHPPADSLAPPPYSEPVAALPSAAESLPQQQHPMFAGYPPNTAAAAAMQLFSNPALVADRQVPQHGSVGVGMPSSPPAQVGTADVLRQLQALRVQDLHALNAALASSNVVAPASVPLLAQNPSASSSPRMPVVDLRAPSASASRASASPHRALPPLGADISSQSRSRSPLSTHSHVPSPTWSPAATDEGKEVAASTPPPDPSASKFVNQLRELMQQFPEQSAAIGLPTILPVPPSSASPTTGDSVPEGGSRDPSAGASLGPAAASLYAHHAPGATQHQLSSPLAGVDINPSGAQSDPALARFLQQVAALNAAQVPGLLAQQDLGHSHLPSAQISHLPASHGLLPAHHSVSGGIDQDDMKIASIPYGTQQMAPYAAPQHTASASHLQAGVSNTSASLHSSVPSSIEVNFPHIADMEGLTSPALQLGGSAGSHNFTSSAPSTLENSTPLLFPGGNTAGSLLASPFTTSAPMSNLHGSTTSLESNPSHISGANDLAPQDFLNPAVSGNASSLPDLSAPMRQGSTSYLQDSATAASILADQEVATMASLLTHQDSVDSATAASLLSRQASSDSTAAASLLIRQDSSDSAVADSGRLFMDSLESASQVGRLSMMKPPPVAMDESADVGTPQAAITPRMSGALKRTHSFSRSYSRRSVHSAASDSFLQSSAMDSHEAAAVGTSPMLGEDIGYLGTMAAASESNGTL